MSLILFEFSRLVLKAQYISSKLLVISYILLFGLLVIGKFEVKGLDQMCL